MATSLIDIFWESGRHLTDGDAKRLGYIFANLEKDIKDGKYILDAHDLGKSDRFGGRHMNVVIKPSEKNKEGFFAYMGCYFNFSDYEANSASLQIDGTNGRTVQYSTPRDGREVSGLLKIMKDLGSKKIMEKKLAATRKKNPKAQGPRQ